MSCVLGVFYKIEAEESVEESYSPADPVTSNGERKPEAGRLVTEAGLRDPYHARSSWGDTYSLLILVLITSTLFGANYDEKYRVNKFAFLKIELKYQ